MTDEFRTEMGKNWFQAKYALFNGETWGERCRAVVEAVCGGLMNQDEVDCLQDVVASDCLSSGAAAEMDGHDRSTRAERVSNNRTRCVIGEFVFFQSSSSYREWSAQLRNDCDYDDDAIDAELKRRLGLDQYEQD